MADPRYISIPRIQLLRAARDNVGEESGWCDGTVVDGRTATVARMGKVTEGWRLSQEWARCEDGTATVARMAEVTVGRQRWREWARCDDGTATVGRMGEV